MFKLNRLLKIIFHLTNLIIILFYLYPGSILGYLLSGDIEAQPQITTDIFNISSNHFFVFLLLSFLGVLAYQNNKRIDFCVKYLFSLSIVLELLHFLIPMRSFEFKDLLGNLIGVFMVFLLFKIWKKVTNLWRIKNK